MSTRRIPLRSGKRRGLPLTRMSVRHPFESFEIPSQYPVLKVPGRALGPFPAASLPATRKEILYSEPRSPSRKILRNLKTSPLPDRWAVGTGFWLPPHLRALLKRGLHILLRQQRLCKDYLQLFGYSQLRHFSRSPARSCAQIITRPHRSTQQHIRRRGAAPSDQRPSWDLFLLYASPASKPVTTYI